MDRICIPDALQPEVFKMVHEAIAHSGIERACEKAGRVIFTRNLKPRITKYIKSCPQCQVAKPKQHKPYGRLQPVPIPDRPFQVLSMDFVTGLPVANNLDAILTVTCKFSKYIRVIPGKDT